MSEEHSSFIIDIKRPTSDGYVACLVITPKRRVGGATDVSAKMERNLGKAKAVQLSVELLTACGASTSLLEQIRKMNPTTEQAVVD